MVLYLSFQHIFFQVEVLEKWSNLLCLTWSQVCSKTTLELQQELEPTTYTMAPPSLPTVSSLLVSEAVNRGSKLISQTNKQIEQTSTVFVLAISYISKLKPRTKWIHKQRQDEDLCLGAAPFAQVLRLLALTCNTLVETNLHTNWHVFFYSFASQLKSKQVEKPPLTNY